jgi:acetyl-CoA carboxylase carboxyltransferase component
LNCNEKPPKKEKFLPPATPINTNEVLPEDRKKSYDAKEIIRGIIDESDFFEVQEHYAKNIVVGFGRMGGKPVGIIANQPKFLAGVLDVNAADKTARFIRFCDAFNIPLVTLVDTPGYLPGIDQEHSGIIRHGAKILYAYSEATVPKFTIIMRKAYGGAYVAMCSKHLGANLVMAWPTAEIAVMGPEGATNIIFKKEIANSENPEETRKKLVQEYEEKFANPYVAASRGYVDLIVKPHETRQALIRGLDISESNKRPIFKHRHGNVPL